jgi:PAS domain S-box-containing protein
LRQAFDELSDDVSRYRAVIEALAEGVVLMDRAGVIQASNSAAQRILGLPADRLHGHNTSDPSWNPIREDGSPMPASELPAVITLRTGEPQSQVVFGLWRAPDDITWISVNSRPLRRPGATHPYAVVCSFIDITQARRTEARLRLSEESYRSLVEHSMDAMLFTSTSGEVFSANPAACRILGYTEQQLLQGGRALYVETSDPRFKEAIAERQRTGRFSRELTMVRADGSTFAAEVTSVVFTDAHGNQRTSTLFRDLTERQRLERMKSEFVSTVSHELRTPLTSIRGVLGLLDGGVLGPITERAALHVKKACANAQRLSRLIDDIVDHARMGSGQFALNPSDTSPGGVVTAALEVTQGVATNRGVGVSVGAVCGGSLRADEGRLCQVLTNLVGNALKFSLPGTEVTVSAREAGPERVRFEVADQGPGISAENIQKLFQRFQQLDSSDSRVHGGTGLGLAISREIVEAHGGKIGVFSTVGMGSNFWFEVPRSPPATLA